MKSEGVSKEIELKFRRLATQMLPKSNFSNALVINSGDGLLCEYLHYLGISHITCIEANNSVRQSVQLKLPTVDFFENLSQLGEKKFDLVFVLDKIDFVKDELQNQVFQNVTKAAHYIVVDLFAFDNLTEPEFIAFRLSATEKIYIPTKKMVINQFPDHLARTIDQAPTHFKGVVRTILHFRKRLPYAVVVADRPLSGKTTLAKHLFSDLVHVELDKALVKINNNELDASDAVKKILQAPGCISLGGKKLYQALVDSDCYIDFVKASLSLYGDLSNKNIVVDGFVPPEYVDKLHAFLNQAGYYVVEIGLTNTIKPDADYSIDQVQNFYNAFYKPN